MRRKIFVIITLFMLFSMPTWQFYLHLDRIVEGEGSETDSGWEETYSVGFPFTYMTISHTRSVDKKDHSDVVSIDKFHPLGFVNLLLFISAVFGFVLIEKKQVRLPRVINVGLTWARLYILAVFLFGLDTISVSVVLFKLGPGNLFLKTWCNVVYNGSVLGRALVFPLPTVTRNYFDITSNLHMKVLFAVGIVIWFIFGMALYKIFRFVKAKVSDQ